VEHPVVFHSFGFYSRPTGPNPGITLNPSAFQMTFLRFLIFWFILIFPLWVLESQAQSLDIFNSNQKFANGFLFKDQIPELENLTGQTAGPVLENFFSYQNRVESQEQSRLLALGIGYLYLVQKEYDKSLQTLKQGIFENFVLDDFRLHFMSLALEGLAEHAIANKDHASALEALNEAEDLRLTLFKRHPLSPFQDQIPRLLADAEKRLGRVYLQLGDYPASWGRYRRSLMRAIPENDEHKLAIFFDLVQAYTLAQDFQGAIDIFVYLLTHSPSPETMKAAHQYLKEHLQILTQNNFDTAYLQSLMVNFGDEKIVGGRKKRPIKPLKLLYDHPRIQEFYEALENSGFSKKIEAGYHVLKKVPGAYEAKSVIRQINRILLIHLKRNSWNEKINKTLNLYPLKELNALGHLFWNSGLAIHAIKVFEKIIKLHPTETMACHKALFFLGRIYEDRRNTFQSIARYKKLLESYSWGPYQQRARFKIPWLHRSQGDFQSAKNGFEKLISASRAISFPLNQNNLAARENFIPSAQYWLAQTEADLGNPLEKTKVLRELIQDHPFDFYAIVGRMELFMDPLSFSSQDATQPSQPRKPAMGELDRLRISRAEKLISIGFLKKGVQELSQIENENVEDPEFLFYLAGLIGRGQGYQQSINFSWKISRQRHHTALPRALVELLFPQAFLEDAKQESLDRQLDPHLVLALMRQESAFNPRITSTAKAIGLMQLLPSTATEIARSADVDSPTHEDLKQPQVNIRLGVKYLDQLLKKFDENIIFALAAYNAGPKKVRSWTAQKSGLPPLEFIESIPFIETRNYVKKVLRNYVIYKSLYENESFTRFEDVLSIRN